MVFWVDSDIKCIFQEILFSAFVEVHNIVTHKDGILG